MRTHLLLPDDLVEAVDRLVGRRNRSRFVEQAVRERLRTEGLLSAIEATAGTLTASDHPEWAGPDDVAAWVHESRWRDDARPQRPIDG